jgi:hypothetical protein
MRWVHRTTRRARVIPRRDDVLGPLRRLGSVIIMREILATNRVTEGLDLPYTAAGSTTAEASGAETAAALVDRGDVWTLRTIQCSWQLSRRGRAVYALC